MRVQRCTDVNLTLVCAMASLNMTDNLFLQEELVFI